MIKENIHNTNLISSLRILGIFLLFVMQIFYPQKLSSQIFPNDSNAIKYVDAIKLTDNFNSHLPDSIRLVIVDYFRHNGINSQDYYTTGYTNPSIVNDKGCVGLLRIGAIRDLYDRYLENIFMVGASGGAGDDIIVIFDTKFKKVEKIVSAE